MAIVYPLVKSESYEGACYGNFLSKRVGHCVRPIDPEVAFEDIRSPVPSESLKTRVVGRNSLRGIHRIPGSVFGDDSLDALLVHSRCSEGRSPGFSPAEDILSVLVFDPEEQRMKRIRRYTVTYPDRGRKYWPLPLIAICDVQGINYGSILFDNGTDHTVFKLNHTGEVETLSLTTKFNEPRPCDPECLFWVTSSLAAVVHDSYPATIEFIEFGTKRKENLTLAMPDDKYVRYVGAGPMPGTVIVLFHFFLTIYKLTDCGVQIVKELTLDLPQDHSGWYPLDVLDSSGNFYISGNQDILLVREEHPPTLLKLHESIPGRLTPLGFGMFAIATGSNGLRFCQFRLNRDGTSVFAELLGSHEAPSEPTLIARTRDSTFGQRFWWQQREIWWEQRKSGNMIVTQGKIDVRCDVCFSEYNGSVTGISATTTAADQQCYILSTDSKSVLVTLENRELRPVKSPSWQVLDEETVFANDKVQVTRTQIYWRNGTAVTFDDRINVVSCQGSLLALATDECAHVYFEGEEEVETINVENTIISISCNAVGVVAVLAFDKLIIYDHSTKSTEERAVDVFCTAVIVTEAGAVRVGTGRGELLGDSDLKLSSFPIRKIFTYGSDLIVTDTAANAYHVSKQGEVTRFSLGITNALLPLRGVNYLTVFEGVVHVVAFSTKAPRCSENSTVSAFPGAPDSINYSFGSFYAFYEAKREVHVATPQDFINSTVYRFAEVESMTEESHHHYFPLDPSRILELVDDHPDNSGRDYMDDRIIVRLHKVVPELNQCLFLHEQEVTLCCEYWHGPQLKFGESSQMFCIDGGHVDCVHGTIVSDQVILRRFNSDLLDIDCDNYWILDVTFQEVIIVTENGHVRSTPIENGYLFPRDPDGNLELSSVYSLGRILDSEHQSCMGAVPLSRKHVYAATIETRSWQKSTRIVVFSVDGVVSILANFAIPDSDITLLPSDNVSLDQNGGEFTPDFYIGTPSGALYSVSLPQDAQLVKSLGLIQLSLLQDMGFDENLEDLKGSIDGSLLQAAAQRQEYKHLFERNGVSAESFSAGVLNLIG